MIKTDMEKENLLVLEHSIPDDWARYRLGDPDITMIIMGQSPDSSTYNTSGIGLPFFQGKADFGFRYPTPTKWCSSPTRIAEAGDVLVSVRAPVGDANIALEKCCIGRGIAAIRPGSKADKEFLFYTILHHKPDLDGLGSGAIFKAINKDTLYSFEIQLPPLPEQRAIAAVLAKIQSAVEVQDKIVATLNELKAATMAKLFREGLRDEPLKQTKIGEMPESWEVKSIGQVFEFTTKHRGFRFENRESIPFIPMDLIPLDRLFFSDFVLRKPQEITSGTYFEEGDLLISKITPCFENGKQGIATKIPGSFGIATTEVIPIKANEWVSHLPFLAMYLLDSEVRNSLAGKMEGATGRQRLSKSVLEEWLIPFPSFSEQCDIADVLLKIQTAEESNANKRDILKSLFSSMLHLLMTGQVRATALRS